MTRQFQGETNGIQSGTRWWTPGFPILARVQRAAAHGLAAALALGEDLNDEEKIAELDKFSGELVTILASRMTDPLPIFPQLPVADLMGACAENLPTLGRCAVMRMWRNLGFQPQFCMR